jgi:hypothetical protein
MNTTCATCDHEPTEHSTLAGCLAPGCDCEAGPVVAAFMPPPSQGLAEGRARRDAGVAAAGTTAPGALVTAWKAKASKGLEDLIREGSYFSADDLVALVGLPPRRNMLGGVFIGARKAGLIRPVGYTQATRPEAHARVQRTWAGA